MYGANGKWTNILARAARGTLLNKTLKYVFGTKVFLKRRKFYLLKNCCALSDIYFSYVCLSFFLKNHTHTRIWDLISCAEKSFLLCRTLKVCWNVVLLTEREDTVNFNS